MANGLGRGLSSLIPQKVAQPGAAGQPGASSIPVASVPEGVRVLEVAPDKIRANPKQPRHNFAPEAMSELKSSIKEYGIIQPLVVTRSGDGYEIIAGERRWRAAKELGLKRVPVMVREVSEQDKLEISLIENLQREDLDPIETAQAYRRLLDEFDLTQEQVAEKVGKSRPLVTNTLRYLNLPTDMQKALIEGRINEGHAKILVGLESDEKQRVLFDKIVHSALSVDSAVKESRALGGTKAARIKINYQDKDKEFAFRQYFSTKVEIKRRGKGGQVIIDFFSDDELQAMVAKLK